MGSGNRGIASARGSGLARGRRRGRCRSAWPSVGPAGDPVRSARNARNVAPCFRSIAHPRRARRGRAVLPGREALTHARKRGFIRGSTNQYTCSGLRVLGCAQRPGDHTGSGLRAATLIWKVGVNQKGRRLGAVESILPATFQGKRVGGSSTAISTRPWTGCTTRTTVRRRSRHRRADAQHHGARGLYLALTFHGGRVTIEKDEGSDHLRTEVEVATRGPRSGRGGAALEPAARAATGRRSRSSTDGQGRGQSRWSRSTWR